VVSDPVGAERTCPYDCRTAGNRRTHRPQLLKKAGTYQNDAARIILIDVLLWSLALLLMVGTPLGVSTTQGDTGQAGNGAGKSVGIDYVDTTTHHVLEIGNQHLVYTATAGTLPIPDEPRAPQAKMFYVDYTMPEVDATQRPIAFVVNGGPGAAAVYLHLGALGPQRLVFNADGTLPPAPARLTENPFTWLTFTDLVFIDPIGTGYSRSVPQDDGKDHPKTFWGIEEDLKALTAFIQLYLTRHNRWLSPKFLVGESYGGFRVATLSERLAADARIAINGVVLISPALEFSLLAEDPYRLLPWILPLPAYAAVAQFHHNASLPPHTDTDSATVHETVERFSLTEVLPGLAQGDTLEAPQAQELYTRIAHTIGLPSDLVERQRGRIAPRIFAKALLHDTQRLVSLYDGTITATDPNPGRPVHVGQDPYLASLTAAFTAAFHSYARDVLHFATDVPYHALNPQVSKAWDWRSGVDAPQGFAGAANTLKSALTQHPGLQVLIAHGYYDLVTPYFSSVFAVHQMALDAVTRSHLVLRLYAGGHMFYTHAAAHEQFARDAQVFFHSALPPAAKGPAGALLPEGQ
jgi:carboxypeptidase C (cathepsin A)